jgi:hypothetical protein
MAPLMKITAYLAPGSAPLVGAERFRLLEVALRAFDPTTAATPGSALYWSLVAAVREEGHDADAVEEQAGFLLQAYRYSEGRPLTSALRMLPGGATLYTIGEPATVLSICIAAAGGNLPSAEREADQTQGWLALAIREMKSVPADLAREEVEQQLTMVGFITLRF